MTAILAQNCLHSCSKAENQSRNWQTFPFFSTWYKRQCAPLNTNEHGPLWNSVFSFYSFQTLCWSLFHYVVELKGAFKNLWHFRGRRQEEGRREQRELERRTGTSAGKINGQTKKKTMTLGRPGVGNNKTWWRWTFFWVSRWLDGPIRKVWTARLRRQSDGVAELHAVSASAMSLFLVRIPPLPSLAVWAPKKNKKKTSS